MNRSQTRRNRLFSPRPWCLAVALGGLVGCGGNARDGGGGGTASMRDSAGVALVENHGTAWAADRAWTVADAPSLDVGGTGDPVYELGRVVGALRLRDGRLVVANAATSDIRFFDPQGKHLDTKGRQGTGPGEYQAIAGLWLGANDSLLVADVAAQRLTILDDQGELARSFSLGGRSGFQVPTNGRMSIAFPVGWFADGSVLGMEQGFRINDGREGRYRDTVTLVRYGPDGAAGDTIARAPGVEMEQIPLTFGGRTTAAPSPVPLGRSTVVAVAGDRAYLGENDAWRIEVRGADGRLRRIVRTDARPTPVTPADQEADRQQRLEQLSATPQFRSLPAEIKTQFEARIRNARYPETLPFLGAMLPAADGNLWIEEVVGPSQEQRRYAVLDSSGVLLGRVTMPADFRPTFVDGGAVVGVWTDPDDVEHVRIYLIRKP